jgi:toxin ParE1/3/4
MADQFRLSALARWDIAALLERSREQFGEKSRLRYEALLKQAILDVAADPERIGSQLRPEFAPAIRFYHLRYSRDRVKRSLGRVRSPRHLLVYQVVEGGIIEVVRVLHDSMDLERHLPEDYRT